MPPRRGAQASGDGRWSRECRGPLNGVGAKFLRWPPPRGPYCHSAAPIAAAKWERLPRSGRDCRGVRGTAAQWAGLPRTGRDCCGVPPTILRWLPLRGTYCHSAAPIAAARKQHLPRSGRDCRAVGGTAAQWGGTAAQGAGLPRSGARTAADRAGPCRGVPPDDHSAARTATPRHLLLPRGSSSYRGVGGTAAQWAVRPRRGRNGRGVGGTAAEGAVRPRGGRYYRGEGRGGAEGGTAAEWAQEPRSGRCRRGEGAAAAERGASVCGHLNWPRLAYRHECWPHLGGVRWLGGWRVVANVGPTPVRIFTSLSSAWRSVRRGHGWSCSSRSGGTGGWRDCRSGSSRTGRGAPAHGASGAGLAVPPPRKTYPARAAAGDRSVARR